MDLDRLTGYGQTLIMARINTAEMVTNEVHGGIEIREKDSHHAWLWTDSPAEVEA